MRRLILFIFLIAAAAGPVGAQAVAPMSSGVVPVVSHNPGANGSQWSTSVYLHQVQGSAPAQVHFIVHSPDGMSWEMVKVLSDPAGSAQIDDVLRAVDASIPNGSYVMSWWSTQPVVMTTRTFTTESSGSYGQGIGSVAENSGFGSGGSVSFAAPMELGAHRVNVGISNAGSGSQTFSVTVLDEDGQTMHQWSKTVPAYSIIQFKANEGMSGAGSIRLTCEEGCNGNAYAYTSVVVNDSNDAFYQYASAAAGVSETAPVMTVRDEKGVFFITGGSFYDVFDAMGYAVATDRLWQAETYRRLARGRLSEILGSTMLPSDVLMRTIGYSDEELDEVFSALDTETKTAIQGYVDGFNRRIADIRNDHSLLPYEFNFFGLVMGREFLPEDWTTGDVIAWTAAMQRFFDPEALDMSTGPLTGQIDNLVLFQTLSAVYGESQGAGMFADLRWNNDPASLTYIQDGDKKVMHRPSPLPTIDLSKYPDLHQALQDMSSRRRTIHDALVKANALPKMGSYAWVVSGEKTASGQPIIYSGPQMGFSTPSIVMEASIIGGGLKVSGMTIAGLPGIVIGRTPHHAWSMQVGHAHTVDFYLEAPQTVSLHHMETIKVLGGDDVSIPVFRSAHGPVIEPLPYDPSNPPAAIISWKYAHLGMEASSLGAFLGLAKAESVEEFGASIEGVAVSQHFCYADRDGNIAYWMSGHDPIRPEGVDVRFPLLGDGTQEWPGGLKARSHAENPTKGYFSGWNNKTNPDYDSAPNNPGSYQFGPANRAHVIDEYLSTHNNLSFEDVRDLALNIATTSSLLGGGNTWSFVADDFKAAVASDPTDERNAAVALLDAWDGHFVDGGESQWVAGTERAEAWILQDRWISEFMRLVFEDEFTMAGYDYTTRPHRVLFNVLLHALAGENASVPTHYNWFADVSASGKPEDAEGLILLALDNVLADLGSRPWQQDRGLIVYRHDILGQVHTTPWSSRSTYAHCVEYGTDGPTRIESMFPLGETGMIWTNDFGQPVMDDQFLGMTDVFDAFAPRSFPLFE